MKPVNGDKQLGLTPPLKCAANQSAKIKNPSNKDARLDASHTGSVSREGEGENFSLDIHFNRMSEKEIWTKLQTDDSLKTCGYVAEVCPIPDIAFHRRTVALIPAKPPPCRQSTFLACFGTSDATVFLGARGGARDMKMIERVRQVVSDLPGVADLKQQTEKGWRLVAIEWEREVEAAEGQLPCDVPFGLQIAPETHRLEENPAEREVLFQLMELIVQEGSYARIAKELNLRGFRTRQGAEWSPISVFEMLPRLIEVGPHMFRSSEWQRRKRHRTEAGKVLYNQEP